MKETIHSYEDLLRMLDNLLKEENKFNWDNFYSDRERKIPFFENHPDENLRSEEHTSELQSHS